MIAYILHTNYIKHIRPRIETSDCPMVTQPSEWHSVTDHMIPVTPKRDKMSRDQNIEISLPTVYFIDCLVILPYLSPVHQYAISSISPPIMNREG